MLVLCSVNLGKEGLVTDLTQKSCKYFLCVFVPYRYSDPVNLTEGRCPGSKAMIFNASWSRVTVSNVNIGDCDYTIAFWIRLIQSNGFAEIVGSSRSGKILVLATNGMSAHICPEVSTEIYMTCMRISSAVVVNNWTHVAVTCEQDNRVKVFFNGEIGTITSRPDLRVHFARPPKETFFINYYYSPVIMDFHILGFALPRDEIYDLYRG